jgi:hypothetical protein
MIWPFASAVVVPLWQEMSPGLPGYEEHVYSYHVIYNESYRVPMIFLQGHFLGVYSAFHLA